MKILLVLGILALAAVPAATQTQPPRAGLQVLTYNLWHGLRNEGRLRLAGEEESRRVRRQALKLTALEELGADLLLLQEVNPAPRQARGYARRLGLDEVHKVANCGIKLGPVKIPANLREGLAILARPELRLRRLGKRRLSGPGGCFDRLGLQFGESRYALFAEVTFEGRRLLVVNTHLHNLSYATPEFRRDLGSLVGDLVNRGALTVEARDQLLRIYDRRHERQQREVGALLAGIDRWLTRGDYAGVILGGDFNTVPGSSVLTALKERGFENAAAAMGESRPTTDPVLNADNHAIGNGEGYPYPTFDRSELEALYDEHEVRGRQIDHLFVLNPESALRFLDVRRVLDAPRKDLFLSDHFAIWMRLEGDQATGNGLPRPGSPVAQRLPPRYTIPPTWPNH